METPRIGIGIPCLLSDKTLMEKYCFPSINRMVPAPDCIYVYYNDGVKGGLLELRDKIFDKLFLEMGCDIVLVCDTDFMFMTKGILNMVRNDIVVDFITINRFPISSLILLMMYNIVRKPWAGCYSMPKKVYYEQVKGNWDGTDSSIHKAVNMKYSVSRIPRVRVMRRNMIALKQLAIYGKTQGNIISKMIKLSRLVSF